MRFLLKGIVRCFLCIALILPLTATAVQAEAVEYYYVGNPYENWCGPIGCYDILPADSPYSEGDHVEIAFTMGEPLPPNMAMTDVSTLPGFSYTATDGVWSFISEYPHNIESFAIGTDETGSINEWEIVLWDYPEDMNITYYPPLVASENIIGGNSDDTSILDGEGPTMASVDNNPGNWTIITQCSLAAKFFETKLYSGMQYYTDRDYTLTSVPFAYQGMDAILLPNDDRNLTASSDYLTFEMPYDGTVYVAYDNRVISLPNWMNGFIDTGDRIYTSLRTQPYLKIFSRSYTEGDCVNLGANKADGFVGWTVSNYIVFYSDDNAGPAQCELDTTKFDISTMAIGAYYYTDRNYTITGGVPSWMFGRWMIQTPNDDRFSRAASGYVRFTNPADWWVYVLFDSRSMSVPDWLAGWTLRKERITTSLATQPYMKVYRKMFNAGDCVDLGGNYGPGSSGEIRSNYVVVYGQ